MPDPLHPHYDEVGVTYDGGFFYADGLPDNPPVPTPRRNKAMTTLSPNLSRKNPAQLIALADVVSPKIAPEAPAVSPLPVTAAKIPALKIKRDKAKASSDAYEAAKLALVTLKATRDADADELRDEHRSVVSSVESEARGNVALLSASGYALSAAPVPATVPGQIQNLAITAGDMPGTLDGTHDPEDNSATYEWQIGTVDPIAGPWTTVITRAVSNVELTGLTSGQRVWVRVRGTGSKGSGPWSDPATKIVP